MVGVAGPNPDILDKKVTFVTLGVGLDKRLIKAVAKMGIVYPTLVQTQAIPLALEGKDLLVRAKTGSGKTIAYGLPLLQKLLVGSQNEAASKAAPATKGATPVKALVLVPTRELVDQTYAALYDLTYYCRDVINIVALSGSSLSVQTTALREGADVVVATPGRLVEHLTAGTISLKTSVETLVIDEADLVLSYGCEADVRTIAGQLPRVCQSFLMSATLSTALEDLKRVVLHNAVTLKLEEGESDGKLAQFFIRVSNDDKYLALYAMIKLELIAGKALFFVNTVDECFRLKLFLERFSIPAAVMNAELPANSRRHILDQFNKGLFDFLIATDASMGNTLIERDAEDEKDEEADEDEDGDDQDEDDDDDDDDDEDDEEEEEEETTKKSKRTRQRKQPQAQKRKGADGSAQKRAAESDEDDDNDDDDDDDEEDAGEVVAKSKKQVKADQEFGVARGVDFKHVTTVVNVDFPLTAASYTHRIGRTARGGANGSALSFVDPSKDEDILARVQRRQPTTDKGARQPQLLPFDLAEIEGFRYRVRDISRGVTKAAIKEARAAELKQEMLNSTRLKAHFEDNPRDLEVLRHEQALKPAQVAPHLAVAPSYLLPPSVTAAVEATKAMTGLGDDSNLAQFIGGAHAIHKGKGRNIRRGNPLKTFAANVAAFGAESAKPSIVTGSGQSTAGRNRWKQRHHKGQWSGKKRTKGVRKTKW